MNGVGSGPDISMSKPALMKSVACVAPPVGGYESLKMILVLQHRLQIAGIAARVLSFTCISTQLPQKDCNKNDRKYYFMPIKFVDGYTLSFCDFPMLSASRPLENWGDASRKNLI
jgi:hypothetical protein